MSFYNDHRKSIKSKDNDPQFKYQHGSKLHAFDKNEAPYPLSYDRDILDLWAIDHALISTVKNIQQTFINFKGKTPRRCLDLGTALGDWVIACATHWTDCTFVGFDLVDLQIPLKHVDPTIANRIEWIHGNFLTSRLPFKDDEFDHIHMEGVAFAVPEHKWVLLFDELNRVLKPGGTMELIQEDAIFPILPKWFTRPLHTRSEEALASLPPETHHSHLPPVGSLDQFSHDHTLLELLFYDVFENRFINPKPSSVLPVYFSTLFRHVLSPPLLHFPMPPIAPLAPLPGQQPSSPSTTTITSDPLDPNHCFMPEPQSPILSQSLYSSTTCLPSDSGCSSSSSEALPRSFTSSTSDLDTPKLPRISSVSSIESCCSDSTPSSTSSKRRLSLALLAAPEDSTRIGEEDSIVELFPVPQLLALEDKVLYMQLYRAVGNVVGTKEAMWDELKARVAKGDKSLRAYGWGDADYFLEPSRKKFEAIFDRYKQDMQVRIALWHSVWKSGWMFPTREPLSGAELAEETRLRQIILNARRDATEEDFKLPSRTIRLLIGVKEA